MGILKTRLDRIRDNFLKLSFPENIRFWNEPTSSDFQVRTYLIDKTDFPMDTVFFFH